MKTQLDKIITSLPTSNAAIKGTASNSFIEGWYPAYSASGQDVWLPNYRYDKKAIIVSAVGARCGKAYKADGKWNVCANTHALFVDEIKADRDFLWYLLNNENWWIKGGSAQPFVKVKESLKRIINLPPLSKQKQIANLLDNLNVLIQKMNRSLVFYDELIKSRFINLRKRLCY